MTAIPPLILNAPEIRYVHEQLRDQNAWRCHSSTTNFPIAATHNLTLAQSSVTPLNTLNEFRVLQ